MKAVAPLLVDYLARKENTKKYVQIFFCRDIGWWIQLAYQAVYEAMTWRCILGRWLRRRNVIRVPWRSKPPAYFSISGVQTSISASLCQMQQSVSFFRDGIIACYFVNG